MYLLYADEFGHDGPWTRDDPKHGHHPAFGLAGVMLPGSKSLSFERSFLYAKRSFYKNEITLAAVTKGIRPERFETKQISSERDLRFVMRVLELLRENDGVVFAFGHIKLNDNFRTAAARYNSTTQGLMKAFEKHLRSKVKTDGCGVILMDRRDESRDVAVHASAQSYMFSSAGYSNGFRRLVEIPLLLRSEWHHGIQAADLVGRAIGHVCRYRVAEEAKLRRCAQALLPKLLSLAVTSGSWSSIYVRGLPLVDQPRLANL